LFFVHVQARRRLSKRPWRVDDFDDFLERVYGSSNSQQQHPLDTATNAPAVAPTSAGSQQGAQQVQQQMQQLQLQAAAQQQAEQQQHTADDPATQLLASTTESPFCNASAVAAAASGQAGSSSATAPATNSSSSAFAHQQQQQQQHAGVQPQQPPFRRVMVFVDNAGADIVLGMLPFVREMLRLGCEVVMVANSLPAINDITAAELRRCGLGPVVWVTNTAGMHSDAAAVTACCCWVPCKLVGTHSTTRRTCICDNLSTNCMLL
jgi:hypothetical protein